MPPCRYLGADWVNGHISPPVGLARPRNDTRPRARTRPGVVRAYLYRNLFCETEFCSSPRPPLALLEFVGLGYFGGMDGRVWLGLFFAFVAAVSISMAAATNVELPFFSWTYWQEGGRDTSRSEIVRNLGLLLLGFIGLGFGIWRAYTAYRQTIVAEQGLVTERFTTAVQQLGSEQLPVRIGGIYALWRMTEDAKRGDILRVVDLLSAFVRNPPFPDSFAEYPLRPDVQRALQEQFFVRAEGAR